MRIKSNQTNKSVIARNMSGLKITVANLITVPAVMVSKSWRLPMTVRMVNLRFSLNIPVNHIHTHFFYKRVYLHIPLIMYFICIIRGSSQIKLGSLQDNRNYLLG